MVMMNAVTEVPRHTHRFLRRVLVSRISEAGSPTPLPEGVRKSLENLYCVLRDDGKWVLCEQVLQCWKGYREEVNYLPDQAEMVELRGNEYPVWNQATWSERLRAADDGTLFGDI